MKKKVLLITGFILLVLLAAAAGCNAKKVTEQGKENVKKTVKKIVEQPKKNDRILVIAPHPDDEALGAGAAIAAGLKKGAHVKVVVVTNGDGYRKGVSGLLKIATPTPADFVRLGELRRQESINAVLELGLSKTQIYFLGFPDGGIASLFNECWDTSRPAKGVNGYTASPYKTSLEPGVAYSGSNLARILEELIESFAPTVIYYPDMDDDHNDHWAVSAFTDYVTTRIGWEGKKYTYIVHWGTEWPLPWAYLPNKRLYPPPALEKIRDNWIQRDISGADEELKKKAVDQYGSQITLGEMFLDAFVRINELFGEETPVNVERTENSPGFYSGGAMPFKVLSDPEYDSFQKQLKGVGDLTALGMVFRNMHVYLAIETRADMTPEVSYIFHLRFFPRDPAKKVRRLDFRYLNGQGEMLKLAKNTSEELVSLVKGQPGERFAVKIPLSAFKDCDWMMLCAESRLGSTIIDRTAWTTVRLP